MSLFKLPGICCLIKSQIKISSSVQEQLNNVWSIKFLTFLNWNNLSNAIQNLLAFELNKMSVIHFKFNIILLRDNLMGIYNVSSFFLFFFRICLLCRFCDFDVGILPTRKVIDRKLIDWSKSLKKWREILKNN